MKNSLDAAANIGMREHKLRRTLGIVLLLASFALSYSFVTRLGSSWWGLFLLVTYYQGVRFLLDYQTGTCPLKAELGQSKLEGAFTIFGEKIADQVRVMEIRARSRKALAQAVTASAGFTLLTIFIRISMC